LATDL
jgi:hypothetical protein